MTSKTRKTKIAQKKEKIRAQMWPKLDKSNLWDRKTSDGWLSVPRAMPLVLRIVDILAPKGKPVSSTYFELWCRTFDDSFVIVSNPREMAFFSGFTGERAESTWRTRMNILDKLGFIDAQGSSLSPIHYVLLYNPFLVIKKHHEEKNLNDDYYNTLLHRLIEVGTNDLQDDDVDDEKNILDKKLF
jgi:hypothetical protein